MTALGRIRRAPALLVLGDLAVILVFLVAGSSGHEDGLTAHTFARTFLPFAAVWLLVGSALGAFKPPMVIQASAIWRVALVWVICGLLALALRSILFQRDFFSAFTIVSLVFIGVLLVLWRLVYGFAARLNVRQAR